jgi:hypothetical protein
MPTEIYELFNDAVQYDIRSQLKAIYGRPCRNARFARKVRATRLTEMRFAASAGSSLAVTTAKDPYASPYNLSLHVDS